VTAGKTVTIKLTTIGCLRSLASASVGALFSFFFASRFPAEAAAGAGEAAEAASEFGGAAAAAVAVEAIGAGCPATVGRGAIDPS
jgi:hypothetical protein